MIPNRLQLELPAWLDAGDVDGLRCESDETRVGFAI
jgi:hypothetical protein